MYDQSRTLGTDWDEIETFEDEIHIYTKKGTIRTIFIMLYFTALAIFYYISLISGDLYSLGSDGVRPPSVNGPGLLVLQQEIGAVPCTVHCKLYTVLGSVP